MSRSYKQIPAGGKYNTRGAKKCANRRVRRLLRDEEMILDNKDYRKVYPSWDISDYPKDIAPSFEIFCERQLEKYLRFIILFPNSDIPYPTLELCKKLYQKWYIRK